MDFQGLVNLLEIIGSVQISTFRVRVPHCCVG